MISATQQPQHIQQQSLKNQCFADATIAHGEENKEDFMEVVCQKNEEAARFIEVGKYSIAIDLLVRALRLNEQCNDNDQYSCDEIDVEDCMLYSEERCRVRNKHNKANNSCSESTRASIRSRTQTSNSPKRCLNISSSTPRSNKRRKTCTKSNYTIDHSEMTFDSYIYNTPIQIFPHALNDNHWVGKSTMKVILTFNMALAHHLQYLEENQMSPKNLRRTMQFYEFAFQCKKKAGVDSLRFNIALANNMGEVHCMMGNEMQHLICLENVLSTVVFMTVYEEASETETRRLEGFVGNASRLILRDECAGAA